jgi:predicted GNAT family acetyltransferase
LVAIEHAPFVAIARDDDSLDIRPTEVETEVAARGLATALGHQVSPVTRA